MTLFWSKLFYKCTVMTLFKHNIQPKCATITLFPHMPFFRHQRVSKNNGLVTRHVQHCVCANKSDNLLLIQVVEGVY